MTNAWLQYKKIHSKNTPMLAFMRKIVVTMLASSERKKLFSLQYAQQVLENLRTNKFDYVMIKGKSKTDRAKFANVISVYMPISKK